MFWIYAPSIHTNFLPLFLSIALCLETNWYKVCFIQANILQKHHLKKYNLKYCENNTETLKNLWITKLLIWNGVFHDINIPSIQNYYFENWYFWNDLQIFKQWVNAKSEITKLNYEDFSKYKTSNNTWNLKYTEIVYSLDFTLYNYWILWFFSQNPLSSIKHFWEIFKNTRENKRRKYILKNIKAQKLEAWKYILIGFQVHDDTQILHNSSYIKKMDDILDFFYSDIKNILPECKIIVKEHPMDIGRIDYSHLQEKYPEIIWIQKWNISEYIDISDYTICVNSSVWLQALAKYKKVLTLWENFYSNNPWVKHVKSQDEFSQKLRELKKLDIHLHQKHIDEYIYKFKTEIFVSGWWWEDFDWETIQSICQRLI